MVDVVRERQPIDCDELDDLVAGLCGIDEDDEVGMTIVEKVFDVLIDDEGPLALLSPDVVVDVESFVGASVFTHRLNELELELGILTAPTVDLAAFRRRDGLRLRTGE